MADEPESIAISNARQIVAYVLMGAFIALTSVGAFLIYPPAGFIMAGIGCGIYAYLLGAN